MRPESKAMDSMSEVSEGTNGTSVSGRGSTYSEDLHDFALQIGLSGPDQLYQDRFRVDRRKLEVMIRVRDDSVEPADMFFQRIMDETCTHISWPSRLKIGAKSKKDPHIRISGRERDVIAAKSQVMTVLDTRSNRVTMKLDVSYTDHSHIIGRGGLSIKGVMEETGCHIHFPDSNRNNPNEKSNQVSIAGEIDGVERARARVRELTPLIFSFELPILGTIHSLTDANTPYIACIQEKYNVQVLFRTRPKLHSTLVLVKGCEWELPKVKEATMLLIKHMCDNLAGQVTIHMMMEISPQHHSIVVGTNHENLKQIIMRTGAKILFPDATDPNIPPLKRSNVTISGGIHNVFLARQQLIGMLPLLLIFDVPEHALKANMNAIGDIMNSLEVIIQMKNKPKQNVVSVTIKGLEKNASNIYEARRQLMGLKELAVIANIPATYTGLTQVNVPPNSNHSCNLDLLSPNYLTVSNPLNNMIMQTQCQSPMMMNHSEIGWNQLGVPFTHQLMPTHQQLLLQHLMPRGARQTERNTLGHSLSLPDIAGGYSSLSSNTSPLSSPCASPRNVSPVQNLSTDQASDVGAYANDIAELRAPGFERPRKNGDYQQLKLQATQAVQGNPKSSDLRVPTSSWSGYGFSQSSPSAVLKEQKQREARNMAQMSEIWTKNPLFPAGVTDTSGAQHSLEFSNQGAAISLASSNYLESLPSGLLATITSDHIDLPTLLASLGLEKYTQLFRANEVDLATFQTLNEIDLKEIGVSAFGARRKMLLCISELNKRQSMFRCSAAVGAERKSSSSTNSLNENW